QDIQVRREVRLFCARDFARNGSKAGRESGFNSDRTFPVGSLSAIGTESRASGNWSRTPGAFLDSESGTRRGWLFSLSDDRSKSAQRQMDEADAHALHKDDLH